MQYVCWHTQKNIMHVTDSYTVQWANWVNVIIRKIENDAQLIYISNEYFN